MYASPEDIARAIALLNEGRLIAFPTETVYGLGANAFERDSVRSVFEAKGRPATNPLIVHVVDDAMAKRVCAEWPAEASTLAARFWPGPLTLVLPKADDLPGIVTGNGPTVAVRCPNHPLTLALLETLGSPIVGPSANRSGYISPTCAAHVRESFDEDEVFILDGGPCVGGIESTVLDLTGCQPRILRPGLLDAETLATSLGVSVAEPQGETRSPRHARAAQDAPARSPGTHLAHYAPRTPTRLIRPDDLEQELRALGESASAVLMHTGSLENVPAHASVHPPHRSLVMPNDPSAYAARLYAALYEADSMDASVILIVQPWPTEPATGLWHALADRLVRAASPRERDAARDTPHP